MSNPLKGEAEFRGQKLLMNFDRFAGLEDATGKKMPQLVHEFESGLGLPLSKAGCLHASSILLFASAAPGAEEAGRDVGEPPRRLVAHAGWAAQGGPRDQAAAAWFDCLFACL